MPWPSETQRDTEVFGLIDKERERQSSEPTRRAPPPPAFDDSSDIPF
jgi:hypothetical protein